MAKYGQKDICLGVPVVIGRNGWEKNPRLWPECRRTGPVQQKRGSRPQYERPVLKTL